MTTDNPYVQDEALADRIAVILKALNDLISEAAERDLSVTLEPETIKVDRLDGRVAPTLYKVDIRKVLL